MIPPPFPPKAVKGPFTDSESVKGPFTDRKAGSAADVPGGGERRGGRGGAAVAGPDGRGGYPERRAFSHHRASRQPTGFPRDLGLRP
ncbi:hypothetical protein ATK36_5760 [Amycolatopsis sulphurea]|uniref:Uncharacterized protein n=1 Tax=Amycolatopsis sulphurea TaxID=76022 RepID=A0A2A9FJ30_9PSEU|nr:hypothetical protein ATK36_5760 [Amycolatopsis sulphurea]